MGSHVHPFANELPARQEWIRFAQSPVPNDESKRLASDWTFRDKDNPALERVMSTRFVRSTVVEHANRDLAVAVQHASAASVDSWHAQVVQQRLAKDANWKMQGFAVPILFPAVGDLSWSAIADLRSDRAFQRLRAILHEVERESMDSLAAGDVEAAAHHAYERHLRKATGDLGSWSSVGKETTMAVVLAAATGVLTVGVSGAAAIAVGTGVGGAIEGARAVHKLVVNRRTKGWIALTNKIDERDHESQGERRAG